MGQRDEDERATCAERLDNPRSDPAQTDSRVPIERDAVEIDGTWRRLWEDPLVLGHRRRLAAVLRDGVSQDVLALRSYADLLAGAPTAGPEKVAEVAAALREQCDQLYHHLALFITGLGPPLRAPDGEEMTWLDELTNEKRPAEPGASRSEDGPHDG